MNACMLSLAFFLPSSLVRPQTQGPSRPASVVHTTPSFTFVPLGSLLTRGDGNPPSQIEVVLLAKDRYGESVVSLSNTEYGSGLSLEDHTIHAATTDALPQAPVPVTYKSPSASSAYPFPTFEERKARYLYDFIGPGTFIGAGIGALVDQTANLKVAYPPDGAQGPGLHPAHGNVPEWGQGFGGYSKRYASEFGTILTSVTLRYGLGEALREDVLYHRCQCAGFLPRTRHVFAESFTSRTRSGRRLPSIPVLVSPFLASEIGVAAWYPHRYNVSDAFRISGISYYLIPFKNMLKEFTGK